MTMFADELCVRETVISQVNSVASGAEWEKSFKVLTLDNVGDHQRRTGVITSQTSRGNILFDLEGKQVPVHKHKTIFWESKRKFLCWRDKRKEIWDQKSHFKSENFTRQHKSYPSVPSVTTFSHPGNDKLRKTL